MSETMKEGREGTMITGFNPSSSLEQTLMGSRMFREETTSIKKEPSEGLLGSRMQQTAAQQFRMLRNLQRNQISAKQDTNFGEQALQTLQQQKQQLAAQLRAHSQMARQETKNEEEESEQNYTSQKPEAIDAMDDLDDCDDDEGDGSKGKK